MVINRALDAVFIHVTDMHRAIEWYSRLLDLPVDGASHDGLIYDLPLTTATSIILDGYPKTTPARGTGPRVMFATHDIARAHDFAHDLSAAVTDIQDIGSSLVFYLDDPDGNLICIRQPKNTHDIPADV